MPSTNKYKNVHGPKFISNEELYKDKTVLAFVIDGVVVDTLTCEERLGAILQSNPEIINITSLDPFLNGPHTGWKYDGSKFYLEDID